MEPMFYKTEVAPVSKKLKMCVEKNKNEKKKEIKVDPLKRLPNEIIFEILSYLSFEELSRMCLMSKDWNIMASLPILTKTAIYKDSKLAFGNHAWAKAGELESIGENNKEEFNSLPITIGKILKSPCHLFPEKRVGETHILIRIPKTFNGQLFTIDVLGKIAKKHFQYNENGYDHVQPEVAKQVSGESVEKSKWVLMSKSVMEGSTKKKYSEQEQIIINLAAQSNTPYKVAGTLQATACILAEYCRSETRLFNTFPSIYTRCNENHEDLQFAVGYFSEEGLSLHHHSRNDTFDYVGIAPIWEL